MENQKLTPLAEQRLMRLADFLEKNVPPERFSLDAWSTGDLIDCGTAACACGWATEIPEFKEAGLWLDTSRVGPPHAYVEGCIMFGELADVEAVEAFFEIDTKTVTFLFMRVSYDYWTPITPQLVAKRIRKYVENEKAEEFYRHRGFYELV